ncbi:NADH-quinone oxidoreductase subunit L [Salinibacillus xinjiangensis]|uniref:NADH-quinone oxidoreductase subunit L n=1 Tax=Salinibacillus xinjiangensis TaxID=1229268 RepID=A0A6G1X5A5_9BACI|nr:NADH-quinone oxidoreductase subunit L [Salinibacillus xinjiangensis]MRG86183.1 NADH-quinone oxidoreductase subunit L [Salinibacillus xinjiangensis]
MIEFAWLIPALPLLTFLLLIVLREKLKKASGYVAVLISGITFIVATLVFLQLIDVGNFLMEWSWLTIGSIDISFGILLNPLNGLMLLLVAFISFLIHMYSLGYMDGDQRFSTFFAYLSLFTSAMLGLVMSPNLLQFYMFWELVGLGSFLLIGFYFYKNSAKQAAKKAFIMTRIGDVGLLIGLILLFWQTNSLRFVDIYQAVTNGDMSGGMITLIAILIFIGAIGKSGQFPLHTWLPDAMEGPTPVSALIHAATMVAAGVYLVAVMYPLYMASSLAMMIVAIVGAFTAIYAATIGLVQNDLKQVLAYSTISQLGFMMLAMGVLGYTAGIFHLFTHAFFKALLFLAAGSVIHAVHTQNIKEMGGLNQKLKLTSAVFLIGALAISGFPLFSGFFSKEEILASVWAEGQYGLFIIAIVAAFLTSVYMFRLYFLVFHGESKLTLDKVKPVPMTMKIPMMVLALFAIFSGFFNTSWFGTYIADFLEEGATYLEGIHHGSSIWLMLLATVVSLGGIALAYLIYVKNALNQENWKTSGTYQMLLNKYYMDEFYDNTFVKGSRGIGLGFQYVEKYFVRLIILFIGDLVTTFSRTGSKSQTGQAQTYTAVAFLGLVLFAAVYMLKGGY